MCDIKTKTILLWHYLLESFTDCKSWCKNLKWFVLSRIQNVWTKLFSWTWWKCNDFLMESKKFNFFKFPSIDDTTFTHDPYIFITVTINKYTTPVILHFCWLYWLQYVIYWQSKLPPLSVIFWICRECEAEGCRCFHRLLSNRRKSTIIVCCNYHTNFWSYSHTHFSTSQSIEFLRQHFSTDF